MFYAWREKPKTQELKAIHHYEKCHMIRGYKIFGKWREANSQHIIQDNKKIRKFKLQNVMKKWIKFMCTDGDFLVLNFKAQKYHH
jgi:hypothetical protein